MLTRAPLRPRSQPKPKAKIGTPTEVLSPDALRGCVRRMRGEISGLRTDKLALQKRFETQTSNFAEERKRLMDKVIAAQGTNQKLEQRLAQQMQEMKSWESSFETQLQEMQESAAQALHAAAGKIQALKAQLRANGIEVVDDPADEDDDDDDDDGGDAANNKSVVGDIANDDDLQEASSAAAPADGE